MYYIFGTLWLVWTACWFNAREKCEACDVKWVDETAKVLLYFMGCGSIFVLFKMNLDPGSIAPWGLVVMAVMIGPVRALPCLIYSWWKGKQKEG